MAELESRAMPKTRAKTKSAKPTKSSGLPEPTPVRMPAGYVPRGTKPQFLSWEWVTERLQKSHNYWICTTRGRRPTTRHARLGRLRRQRRRLFH